MACLFILFMGFSRQEYWSGLPFPPVDHVLSALFTTTCLSWVVLHSVVHSFMEPCKPLRHDKAVIHEGEKVEVVTDFIFFGSKITAHSNCSHETQRHLLFRRKAMTDLAAAAKSLQSCPTLWDSIDGSLLGSSIQGVLQARTLEWVAISFSNA